MLHKKLVFFCKFIKSQSVLFQLMNFFSLLFIRRNAMKTRSSICFYLFYRIMICGFLLFTLNACGGLTSKNTMSSNEYRPSASTSGKWTLVSGDTRPNRPASYGTRGIAGRSNNPGSRYGSVSWTDGNGNLWLFGGDSGRNSEKLCNDLWKFDGINWTWISGDSKPNQPGIYDSIGTASGRGNPGARYGSISWTDSNGNFWLFGGQGYGSKRLKGYLNDLWKFDGTNWTWISGDNLLDRRGDYGDKGVTAGTSKPGARANSISWIDGKGNLWLFGGYGYAGTGFIGYLNDLWKFDGTNWTWVSGDIRTSQEGVYGDKGVANDKNIPGARSNSVSWIDSKGNLWLFGGFGADSYRLAGMLNDLWKFDGINWTWVSGENSTSNWQGVYGTMGVADSQNRPKARSDSISWIDGKDNLWLFGGVSPNNRQKTLLNDLWKFDGTNWTWVSGNNPENQMFFEDPDNISHPRARLGSVSWADNEGNLWLFGGRRLSSDFFNDLWKFEP